MPMGIGIGLSITRGEGGAWWDAAAYLDADFAFARYAYLNSQYDEAGWLAATGASASGITRTFLGVAKAGAAELLVNGNGSSAAGWTAFGGSGVSLVSTGGELVLTPPGATSTGADGFGQITATEIGKAYLLTIGNYRRGTTINYSVEGRISPQLLGNLGSSTGSTANNATSTPMSGRCAGAAESVQMGVGVRIIGTAGASSGTSIFDDLSFREAVPFQGFEAGGIAAVIKGVLPPSNASAKVVFQTDDDSPNNRNYVRVVYGTDQRLRVIVRGANAEVANLDLGVMSNNASFEMVFSAATNAFRAALIGGPVVADTSGNFPGVGTMRIGRSAVGETWDGTITRVRVLPALSEAEFYLRAAGVSSIVAWGDSLTASAGASSSSTQYPSVASAAFAPARSVVNQGVGGQTSTQIAARMGAQSILVTLSGNQIPASGGVAVTAKNINVLFNSGTFTGTQAGWLSGVYGTMSTDASGNWTFTRASAGSVVPVSPDTAFVPELGAKLRARTAWLWLGRNGAQSGYTVEGDIAAAVASLGHSRYLVGAIITSSADSAGGISTIAARNSALAATYGTRFVDLMAALQAANDGSANDLADIAAGYTPRSKRSDAIHLNDAGYAVVAAAFKAAHDAFGW